MKTTLIEPLEGFVRLRHRAWLSRTYGFKFDDSELVPFSKYRYTNIWRELDRNTRYLINNVQENTSGSLETDILNTLRFRMFNRIDTAEYLVGHFGKYEQAFESADVLYDLLKSRKPNFTAAHASTFGLRNACNSLQTDRLLETVTACANNIKDGDQQEAWKTIRRIHGIAKFMGDMVIMDVTWMGSAYYSEDTAFFPDYKRGAKNGLDYCKETGQGGIEELLAKCQDALADEPVPLLDGTPIVFGHRELEHSVCEYSKYVRVSQATTVSYNDVHMRRYSPGTYTDSVDVDPLPIRWSQPSRT